MSSSVYLPSAPAYTVSRHTHCFLEIITTFSNRSLMMEWWSINNFVSSGQLQTFPPFYRSFHIFLSTPSSSIFRGIVLFSPLSDFVMSILAIARASSPGIYSIVLEKINYPFFQYYFFTVPEKLLIDLYWGTFSVLIHLNKAIRIIFKLLILQTTSIPYLMQNSFLQPNHQYGYADFFAKNKQ